MKRKIWIAMILITFLGSAVLGISRKVTYTNITEEDDVLDHFRVAEFPEALVEQTVKDMRKELPNATFIVRVKVLDSLEYLPQTMRQKVRVEEVYQDKEGGMIKVKDEIWVINFSNTLFLDDMTANMGAVNEMQKEKEYLVFLSKKADVLDKSEGAVYFTQEFIIAPIFCYEDIKNTIVPISPNQEDISVPYKKVRNNEFFIDTKKGEKILLMLKKELLEKYPL